MGRAGIDVMVVSSTDRYLNEYVPTEESGRVWISGFTGSMGDVIVTPRRAYVIVDGRYWIQAEKEVDTDHFEIVRVRHGTGLEAAVVEVLKTLAARAKKKPLRVGYAPHQTTPRSLERLRSTVGDGAIFIPVDPSVVDQARGDDAPAPTRPVMRAVDERRVGLTVDDKLGRLAEWLRQSALDGLLVQRLDDIAYVVNLRAQELPFQATFKSIALVTTDTVYVGLDPSFVPADVRDARPRVRFVELADFWSLLGREGIGRVGFDPDHNTEAARSAIEANGAESVAVHSPIAAFKAYKTPAELRSMKDAFRRADQVVDVAIRWACAEVQAGRKVTEASFARRVEETFLAHGAHGLSFKVISAAGKNGAIIHYSDPSPRRTLKAGDLMLLDTGAYFAEGYATDLTRTFLVGGPKTKATERQRTYYTLVLKAAMAGMRAIFPEGTRGSQIDALVRAPLWAEGLDYAHGTGHGVGINVHEAPPRIAPGATSLLEPGFVFSIEPGLYLPSFGGIRIENLCTVEPLPKKKGFLRVVPLTFSPLDKRLIDARRLSADDREWLRAYAANFKPATIELPEPDGPTTSHQAGSKTRRRARTRKPARRKAARRPR